MDGHAINHRYLHAFKGTKIEETCTKMMDLFYLYNNSPRKLRDRELAEILKLQVKKPTKAHGTRWDHTDWMPLKHSSKAMKSSVAI